MPVEKRTRPLAVMALIFVSIIGLVRTYASSGSTIGVQTIITQSDTGISGISKWYEARITNRGIWPVAVTRCNAIDDAGGNETLLAYSIERWDTKTSFWSPVMALDSATFCKPYPLGIVKAELKNAWLWPGRTLSTGPEITAARLHKGDTARFVVFLGAAGDYSHSIATSAFVVDEEVSDANIPYKVRH